MTGGMHYTPSHTKVCKLYDFQLAFSQLIFHLKCRNLAGLLKLRCSFQCWYSFLILTYLNFRPPFWRRVYWQSIILQKQSVSAACRLLNPHGFLSLIGLLPQSEIIHSASCKPNQKLWLQLQGLKSLLEAKLLVLFCSLIKHIRYMMLLDLVLKIWRTCVAQLNFIL